MLIPYLRCMLLAASVYHLPPRVLPAIHDVERGAPGLVHKDANGSEDFGPMQVNSIWLARIALRAGMTKAATRHRLIDDPCFNIAAAAFILRHDLDRDDGDLLAAIGDYHSRTPALHDAYVTRVKAAARHMFEHPDRRDAQR